MLDIIRVLPRNCASLMPHLSHLVCPFPWIIFLSHPTAIMKATSLCAVAIILAFGVAFAIAVCPHEDGSFDSWSDPSTWDNGKVKTYWDICFPETCIRFKFHIRYHQPFSNISTSQVPIDDQKVTITKPILLDEATARLGGVDIQDGGRLVFSPGKSVIQLLF